MQKALVLLVLFFSTSDVNAQNLLLFQKKYFVQGTDTLPYRMLYPKNYDSTRSYPVVLFLHGAGDRGKDNEKQLSKGGELFIRDSIQDHYPAFVLFPQCSFFSFWSNVRFSFDTLTRRPVFLFQPAGESTKSMQMAIAMMSDFLATHPVKKDQVYVGGLSMGGMGVFEIVKRMPGVFAAAFPICGGGNTGNAPGLSKTSWWVFHGQKDPVVPFHFSEEMVDALRKQGASVKFSAYPAAMHNSWVNAFAEPDLFSWLFSQRLQN